MKKNGTTILIYLLGIGLLFNQVGINYFHNKHNAHKSYQIQSNQAQLHSHGEHCKVCSLDTLFHLYFENSTVYHFAQPDETVVAAFVSAKVVSGGHFTKGRAPPFLV